MDDEDEDEYLDEDEEDNYEDDFVEEDEEAADNGEDYLDEGGIEQRLLSVKFNHSQIPNDFTVVS